MNTCEEARTLFRYRCGNQEISRPDNSNLKGRKLSLPYLPHNPKHLECDKFLKMYEDECGKSRGGPDLTNKAKLGLRVGDSSLVIDLETGKINHSPF